METVKILGSRHFCGYDPRNYRNFEKMTDKKVEALEKLREIGVPAWYLTACKYLPFLEKAIEIKVEWASPKREVVKLYFFRKYQDEVQFLYL